MAKNLFESQGTILLNDVRQAMKILPLESHYRCLSIVVDQLVSLSLVIKPGVILLNEGIPDVFVLRIEKNLLGRFFAEGPKKWSP